MWHAVLWPEWEELNKVPACLAPLLLQQGTESHLPRPLAARQHCWSLGHGGDAAGHWDCHRSPAGWSTGADGSEGSRDLHLWARFPSLPVASLHADLTL